RIAFEDETQTFSRRIEVRRRRCWEKPQTLSGVGHVGDYPGQELKRTPTEFRAFEGELDPTGIDRTAIDGRDRIAGGGPSDRLEPLDGSFDLSDQAHCHLPGISRF